MNKPQSSSKMLPVKNHETLGSDFFEYVDSASFPKAILRYRNHEAASLIGLDSISNAQWLDYFCRFSAIKGSFKSISIRNS